MKICVNLFTLSIDEMDCKLMNLFELLMIKFEKFDKNSIEINEKNQFYTSLGKFCLFYFNNKTLSNPDVEYVIYSKMLEILSHLINNFLDIKDSFEKEILHEYILNFTKIILTIFKDTKNPALFKLSASKLFNSILAFNEIDLIKKLLSQIKENLTIFLANNSFEKFFTLFFTILQFSSKKVLEIKPSSDENSEISNNNQNDLIETILKFLLLFSIEILSKNNVIINFNIEHSFFNKILTFSIYFKQR